MSKNRLIAIIACGALLVGGVSTSALTSFNTNNHTNQINSKILLSAPANNNQAVVINTNKNPLVLYTAANSNSSIASYLTVGEMLTYQTTSNPNFYKVTVQETGATGYISANNIQIIESGLNQAFNNLNEQGKIINVSSNVRLRTQPDMQGNIISNYKNDTSINILGKQGQWYKVEIGNQTGYMYQEYVGIDNSTVNNNPNNKATNTNDSNSNATTSKNSSNKVATSSTPYTGTHVDNMQNGSMLGGKSTKSNTSSSNNSSTKPSTTVANATNTTTTSNANSSNKNSNTTNSNDNSSTSNNSLSKQMYINKLNKINSIVKNMPNGETTAQMLNNGTKISNLWNNELNSISSAISNTLQNSKLKAFQASQANWNTQKDSAIKNLQDQGGSISGVNALNENIKLTKSRCYFLINKYMN